MLVISRHRDEKIVVDLRAFGLDLLTVTVVDIRGDKVRFGIDADARLPVNRQEVFEAIERHKPAEPAK